MAPSRWLRTSTFRWLLGYLIAFLIAGAAVIGYIVWQTNHLLTGQTIETIAAEVTGLREQYRVGGPALLTRTIAERSLDPGGGLYYLTDPAGRRLAGNLNRHPPELAAEGGGGVFLYSRRTRTGEEERQAVGVAIAAPGGYTLIVGRDIQDQHTFALTIRRIVLWGFGFLLLAGLGGGLFASRGILKRIDAMTATSRSIMAGDLARRIPLTGSGDELDRLGESLNAMLERIEQLMASMREVSDNIAHDLKTPLTRLRNRVEGALRDNAGEAHLRATLERTIEEADDLITTFNALLSIARLEAGTADSTMERCDLAQVVRDAVELYEPVAEEHGMRIEVSGIGGPIHARADRQLIGQAVANLIDNAVKYAGRPQGGAANGGSAAAHVTVSLTVKDDIVEIAVADRGPGIPETERGRVLKRFVRLEASRSLPGTGLGLSLVAAVARLHGGTIRLEDNAPGLRVVVALPLAREQNAATTTPPTP